MKREVREPCCTDPFQLYQGLFTEISLVLTGCKVECFLSTLNIVPVILPTSPSPSLIIFQQIYNDKYNWYLTLFHPKS